MSQNARYEWSDQQTALQDSLKGFMLKPDDEQMEAVMVVMRAYADAARMGNIEIPQYWTSYN